MELQRGSEWRRWDLHIHTPFSALNNQYGDNWDYYVKELFLKAIEYDISSIGITDYFSIEGYKKIKTDYLGNIAKMTTLFADEISKDSSFLDKIYSILILPNIEFRLCDIVQYIRNGRDCENKRLQYHIIFDNKIRVQDIEENFLQNLKFSSCAGVNVGVDKKSITRNNLESFGRLMKECQPEDNIKCDYEVGLKYAGVSVEDILEALNCNTSIFKNKYLLVLVEDDITNINWSGQGHMTRKVPYSVANCIFSANERTVKWGLEPSTELEFSTLKPCIWGSDAHDFSRLFKPDDSKYCWIKANLTFEGLKQITIFPESRVYIGVEPPSLTKHKRNPMQYIDKIKISKKSDAKNEEVWFDNEIPLNQGLTTIIGNKGSGKSALSDILGLLCSSKNMNNASFLNSNRFCKGPKKFGDDYEATIVWADGKQDEGINLSSVKSDSIVQYAQYLPQKFIEDTCNNLGQEFQKEVDNVIFSYIDKRDRENTQSLTELINYKSVQTKNKIIDIQNNLTEINDDIIRLERKKTTMYKNKLEENLRTSKSDLERTMANKPEEVIKPITDENSIISETIININQLIEEMNLKIKEVNNEITIINTKISDITNFVSLVMDYKEKFDVLNKSAYEIKDKYNLQDEEFQLTFLINTEGLEKILRIFKNEKCDLENKVSLIQDSGNLNDNFFQDKNFLQINDIVSKETSYYMKIYIWEHYKDYLKKLTTAEQLRYQIYLDALVEWNTKVREITEGSDIKDGISQYQHELDYISTQLQLDLNFLYNQRFVLIEGIFNEIQKKVEIYNEIYQPIESKLKDILNDTDNPIGFSSEVVCNDEIIQRVLSYINKTVSGNFKGETQATSYITKLLKNTDFNNFSNVKIFIQDFYDAINSDFDKTDMLIKERSEFYNYLTSLQYLNVEFSLKMGDKSLTELSPGERGTVLLVFYLALEKSNCPLIIDQPEDNLDNQSVFKKIVPCICKAKENRQVIIVTHNPNIAVACDAEEIIYSEINKQSNKIRYLSGAIEDQIIRQKVIDILEGTKPAFNLRKLKYDM